MAQTRDLNNSPLLAHSNFKIRNLCTKYNCTQNYYRDIPWENNYLTEEVIRFLFIGFQA